MAKRLTPDNIKVALPDRKKKEEQRLAAAQDKFVIRLPDGMRDRIKREAERAGRSMNAEIVYALESMYPSEPDIYDVLQSVHQMINTAEGTDGVPYRRELIAALDSLSERIASGLERAQYRPRHIGPEYQRMAGFTSRISRWERAQEHGVDQQDLERELQRGLLAGRGDWVRDAIRHFRAGEPKRALHQFRLHETRFAQPEAAYAAMEKWLTEYYAENWGDINDPAPWDDFEDE